MAEQRLAAELFAGFVRGTRWLPSEKLREQVVWLSESLLRLLDSLLGEAEDDWIFAVAVVPSSIFLHLFLQAIGKEDPRRRAWLMETLFASLERPATPGTVA